MNDVLGGYYLDGRQRSHTEARAARAAAGGAGTRGDCVPATTLFDEPLPNLMRIQMQGTWQKRPGVLRARSGRGDGHLQRTI